MSRYQLRKRKSPPEDLAKFISAKKRRISTDESSEDYDYKPPKIISHQDDVILYDEEDVVDKIEIDSDLEDSSVKSRLASSQEESSEKESSEKETSEEESEEKEESDTLFSSDIFAEIVGRAAKKIASKRSKDQDQEDLEKVKTTISEEEAARLEGIAKLVKKQLKEEEPDIVKILQTPMTDRDRKRMVQLYEIYKDTIENTYDHYELRLRLISMLRNFAGTPVEESEAVEKESERIMKKVAKTNVYDIKKRIIGLDCDEEVKAKILDMCRELDETPSDSSMYRNLKEKIELAVSLPYRKVSPPVIFNTPEEINAYCVEINAYCVSVRKKLDEELYGMHAVKDELITILINRLTNPGSISTVALEGPPGVGKTAICGAFAKAIGRPFERIALGGLIHPDVLKGSVNEYVGSQPSVILQFLRSMKVSDGCILFDEIDKLGNEHGGLAVQNALLHITDYTQNNEFRDTFLGEFSHDISRLIFMYGMNDKEKINPILRDRLTIIEVEAYSSLDLCEIIKGYLLPKAVKASGMTLDQCSISDSGCNAILEMVSSHIKETGVRKVNDVVRKIVTRINVLRMITIANGTTGELKFKFSLPNFSLPIIIDENVVTRLSKKPKTKTLSYFS